MNTYLIAFSTLFAGSLFLFYQFNDQLKQPYMDEIFHIPQVKHYLDYNFHIWDDKITTFPGLYLFTFIYIKILNLIYLIFPKNLQNILLNNLQNFTANQKEDLLIRSFNLFIMFLTFILLQKIFVKQLQKPLQKSLQNNLKITINNLSIIKSLRFILFPLFYFFSFLYYTDIGSLFFIILSFYLKINNKFTLSGIVCLFSVLFRQSNIIWAFWIVLSTLIEYFEVLCKSSDDNLQKQRKMIGWKGITKIGANNNLLNDIYLFIVFILNNLVIIIKTFWTFILLALGFLLFIFYNKGLTVGDKSNHIAIFHLPQLFYFTMFICFMDPVLLLQNLINLFNYLKQQSFTKNLKYLSLFILSIGILTLLNYHFQYVHLFIKSDNRHYVFYLFRKVFKIHLNNGIIHWVNCLLVSPIYFAGFYLLIINLKEKSNLWKLFFVMCIILNICPLPLVEFRYFIIPYYFFHLQRDANNNETISHQQEYRIELLTILYYLLINTLTIYLFLNKPFIGPDHSQSRFMW